MDAHEARKDVEDHVISAVSRSRPIRADGGRLRSIETDPFDLVSRITAEETADVEDAAERVAARTRMARDLLDAPDRMVRLAERHGLIEAHDHDHGHNPPDWVDRRVSAIAIERDSEPDNPNYRIISRVDGDLIGRTDYISHQPSGKPIGFGPRDATLEIGGEGELGLEYIHEREVDGELVMDGLRIWFPSSPPDVDEEWREDRSEADEAVKEHVNGDLGINFT